MAAQRVEAHRLGVGEALLEKLSARRAAFFLGMPVLIEGAEHGERFAVQEEPAVFRLESPKSDHPLDRIDSLAANDEFDDEVVEIRRFRRPWLSLGKGEQRVESIRSEMIDQARRQFAAARQRRLEGRRSGGAR